MHLDKKYLQVTQYKPELVSLFNKNFNWVQIRHMLLG